MAYAKSLSEFEPNDDVARAQLIELDSNRFETVRGSSLTGDLDFYAFEGRAGTRLTAAVSTWGSAFGKDAVLSLVHPDGRVLEMDRRGGTSNDIAASLSNFPLPDDGRYLLEVRANGDRDPEDAITSYDLHLFLDGALPLGEDAPLVSFRTGMENRSHSGATSSPGDGVLIELALNAGDALLASLDASAARTWFWGADPVLVMSTPSGAILRSDHAKRQAMNGPASEVLAITAETAGFYYLRVPAPDQGPFEAPYLLTLAVRHPGGSREDCHRIPILRLPRGLPDLGELDLAFSIPGSARISDLAMQVRVSHADLTQLDMVLLTPTGGEAVVFQSPSGRLLDLTFADDALGTLAGLEDGMRDLRVRPGPGGSFSGLRGTSTDGEWRVLAADRALGARGALERVDLTYCTRPEGDSGCPGGTERLDLWRLDGEGTNTPGTEVHGWRKVRTEDSSLGCARGDGCFEHHAKDGARGDLRSSRIKVKAEVSLLGVEWERALRLDDATFDRFQVYAEASGKTVGLDAWSGAGPAQLGGREIGSTGWTRHRAMLEIPPEREVEVGWTLELAGSRAQAAAAIDELVIFGCVAKTAQCGDGTIDSQESCDDGNTDTETCGPGIVRCLVCDSECALRSIDVAAGDGGSGQDSGCEPERSGMPGTCPEAHFNGCSASASGAQPVALMVVLFMANRRRSVHSV